METTEHLARLRLDGGLLAEAADRAGPDAAVPTCPGWVVRDLVRHMGDVHRWAAAHVVQRRIRPIGRDEMAALAGPLPADADLMAWFREGHAALIEALETADPELQCWAFLPAPSPLAFWARRQAHETAIHRADAESAAGANSSFPPEFAVDGIEELLFGFFGRPTDGEGPLLSPATLHLRAEDADADWLVRVRPGSVEATREAGPADCSVVAGAADLYLLMWNRRPLDGLRMTGGDAVMKTWRENSAITWSRERA